MNDLPRQKLIEIVARHGKSIVDDARRAEGLFRDNFGSFRREIAVLTMALEEGVAHDLTTVSNTPQTVLLRRLVQRLIDNLALSEDAAQWAVNSWALALGVVTNDNLKSVEEKIAEKAPTNTVTPNQNAPKTQNQQQNKSIQSGVITVSAAHDANFASIGAAINAAEPGAKILVRPGLYEESLIINKPIEIVGDGDAKDIVVISRDASCVLMQSESAVLQFLTLQCAAGKSGKKFFGIDIQSGKLILQNCRVSSDSLSCIAVQGADSNPLIQNCIIHNGTDSGIYFFDSAAGTVQDCEIYRNQNANVLIARNANPTFKNCRISGGTTAGFWICENGLGTIDDCDIAEHQDSGIVATRSGSPVLRGCKIHNSKKSGVFVDRNSSALLENCSIYNNADAGISVDGASIAAIANCLINGNGTVAVRIKGESTVRVENSDLTGNQLATWETEEGVFVENNNNREY